MEIIVEGRLRETGQFVRPSFPFAYKLEESGRERNVLVKASLFSQQRKGTCARVFSSTSYSRFRRDKYMFECLRRRHICCRGFGGR